MSIFSQTYSSSELQFWQTKTCPAETHSSWAHSAHEMHLIHFSLALLLEYGSTQIRQNHFSSSYGSVLFTFWILGLSLCCFFWTINLVLHFSPFDFFYLLFLNSSSKAVILGMSVKLVLLRFFLSFGTLLSRWSFW